MKKIFILLPLVFGLAGCETYNHPPYTAMGDYGFTYDLDNSPSPFVDTSYRPLTPYDLAAPIIVVVTNQPPPRIVYSPMPPIGETHYAGETPARGGAVVAPSTIVEPAGAQPGQPAAGGQGAAGAAAGAAGAATPAYYGGGGSVFFPGNLIQTNTNMVVTNMTSTNNITNTNAFGMVTNTNGFGTLTNTNAFAGGTNRAINEPAGTQLQTNRNTGEPPSTQLQSDRPFGQPPAPQFQPRGFGQPPAPGQSATNRVLSNPPNPQPQVQSAPPQQPLAPVPAPQFRQPPPQRPAIPQIPPASAPLNPPGQRQLLQQGQPAPAAPQAAPAPQNAPAQNSSSSQSSQGSSAPSGGATGDGGNQ